MKLFLDRPFVPCLVLALSPFITIPIYAQVNVTTQHNDNARTGQNLSETSLTTANVNATDFGLIAKMAVDGQVYAQPLVLSNIPVGGGTHSALFIATEHDSVYAFDANTGAQYWHTSFINPSQGITTVSTSSSQANCDDIDPNDVYTEYGITSTPVIDPSTDTLYVVVNTYENGNYFFRLHALNSLTGTERPGSPVVIQDSGGRLNAKMHTQRTALLLSNHHVIFGFSSHCDNSPWYGLVFSYNASTLAQEEVFATVPRGEGGVWMGGDGIAEDVNHYLYFVSGNGAFDGVSSFGDSIIKLPPPPAAWVVPTDSYTPGDQSYLGGSADEDLGSGGVVLLPDLPAGTAHQQRLVEAGKQGIISIVDRNAMGNYCCSTSGSDPNDTNIVQEIGAGQINGMFGSPSYWNGHIYFGAVGDQVKSFSYNLTTGAVSTTPVAHSSVICGGSGHYSCSTSISSNGTSNGIVWALDSITGRLHALNALTLAEIYNSDQVPARDLLNGGVKYAAPTVANGKVYVGSNLQVGIYGEGPPATYWTSDTTPPLQCNGNGGAKVSAKQNGINSLSWTMTSNNGPKLVYSINWNLTDSLGSLGSGVVSGSAVDLSGTGTVSRTPVGAPVFSGTLSFWTTVGTCTAPFSVGSTGS